MVIQLNKSNNIFVLASECHYLAFDTISAPTMLPPFASDPQVALVGGDGSRTSTYQILNRGEGEI
jgi:hypothetical protein